MDTDLKTHERIEKLEDMLEVLVLKIEELEKGEVDLTNDDEDSNYTRVARYKERCTQIYFKICKLKQENPLKNRDLKFSGTNIPSLNRAIERYYNNTKQFPTFCDIVDVVRLVNDKKKLGIPESKVHQTAKTAFKELGSTIKLHRQYDLNNIISSYLSPEESFNGDPADNDEELEKKLAKNRKLYEHKLDDIINHYVEKQNEYEKDGKEEFEEVGKEDSEDDEEDI